MVTCSCEFGVYLLPPCKKQAPPLLLDTLKMKQLKEKAFLMIFSFIARNNASCSLHMFPGTNRLKVHLWQVAWNMVIQCFLFF